MIIRSLSDKESGKNAQIGVLTCMWGINRKIKRNVTAMANRRNSESEKMYKCKKRSINICSINVGEKRCTDMKIGSWNVKGGNGNVMVKEVKMWTEEMQM